MCVSLRENLSNNRKDAFDRSRRVLETRLQEAYCEISENIEQVAQMSEREELSRMHMEKKKDAGFTLCVAENKNGLPNCSHCHGPFYYCSKSKSLIRASKRGTGIVGCNRGKCKDTNQLERESHTKKQSKL